MLVHLVATLSAILAVAPVSAEDISKVTPRRPRNDADLRYWLESMVAYHGYSPFEASQATGLRPEEIGAAMYRFRISGGKRKPRRPGDPLTVLPYPGGRHPRIGFLDGAIDPQRETKVSIFAPWDPESYVVVDVPEAVFSNLGLLYLAHTHVPTIWSEKGVSLEPMEWSRRGAGALVMERRLPNGVVISAEVTPKSRWVEMELRLTNGTAAALTGLRVQVCAMLKGTRGFDAQTNENKHFRSPHAIAKSADGRRWIVMAWERCGRAWGNPPVPCLHSDPVFPDCPPGQTVRVKGRLWFHEGENVEAALGEYSPPAISAG